MATRCRMEPSAYTIPVGANTGFSGVRVSAANTLYNGRVLIAVHPPGNILRCSIRPGVPGQMWPDHCEHAVEMVIRVIVGEARVKSLIDLEQAEKRSITRFQL